MERSRLTEQMDHLTRFLAVMAYQPVDRFPNYEVGVWDQILDRWLDEGLDIYNLH